jgi:ribonuclease VapC
MIAVDTSALMAIVLKEVEMQRCVAVLAVETDAVISAGTLSEALVVAGQRGVAEQMTTLIEGLALTVVPVSEAIARRVAETYARWGKGTASRAPELGRLLLLRDGAGSGLPAALCRRRLRAMDVASA